MFAWSGASRRWKSRAALAFVALVTVPSVASAESTQPRWKGGVLFDDSVRDALRGKTTSEQHAADVASTALLFAMVAAPEIAGAANLTSARNPWPDAAELLAVDAEALGLTWGLVSLVKSVSSRERPYATAAGLSARCMQHPKDAECKSDRNASFFSGHSATAFTGAGLVCVQELAFDPRWASVACGAALTLAATTALLRIVADKHYATDVLVGALVGLASGMLLPYALHFAPFAPLPVARDLRPAEPSAGAPRTLAVPGVQITPMAVPGGQGVMLTIPF